MDGLILSAARAGFAVRGTVDLDRRALGAHGRNFPDTAHIGADVAWPTGLSIKLLPGLKQVGGTMGSPPCRGFSAIGRGDRHDARNVLLADSFRIAAKARPKFSLVENVPGILRKKCREIRARAFSFVEKKYSMLKPMKTAANDYGAPATRKRVLFVGCLEGSIGPLDREHFEAVRVRGALYGLPSYADPHCRTEEQGWLEVSSRGVGRYARMLLEYILLGAGDHVAPARPRTHSEVSGFLGTVRSAEVEGWRAAAKSGKHDPTSKSSNLDPDGFRPTLRAGTSPERGSFQAAGPIHPTECRVVTPREAASIQGFPDWFQSSPTKWHSFRQMGNSVSQMLAERVLAVTARALGAAGCGRAQ